MRDVLFRFGSWCYTGKVELTPKLALEDLPHIIPALRVQHSNMKFLCDVRWIPWNNRFTEALVDAAKVSTVMEKEVAKNEQFLTSLNEMMVFPSRSSEGGGGGADLPTTVALDWLDRQKTIFEFHYAPDKVSKKIYSKIELIATKQYNPCGVVSISIYCAGKFYLTLGDVGGEEQRLLDSRFPNVAAKGKGFKLRSYPKGAEDWPQLRHISVWESISSAEDSIAYDDVMGEEDNYSDRESKTVLEEKRDPSTTTEMEYTTVQFVEPSSHRVSDRGDTSYESKSRDNDDIDEEETAGGTSTTVKESTKENHYGENSQRSLELGKEKYNFPNIWEDPSDYPWNDNNENNEPSSVAAVEECQRFIASSSRISTKQKKPTSVGSCTGSKKTKANLGAFHHLAPLSTRSEHRTSLRDLTLKHESTNVESSEPWDKDGKPKIPT
jgi:hypothetical protein